MLRPILGWSRHFLTTVEKQEHLQTCFNSPLASGLLKHVVWPNSESRSGETDRPLERQCPLTKCVHRRRVKDGHGCSQSPQADLAGRRGRRDLS